MTIGAIGTNISSHRATLQCISNKFWACRCNLQCHLGNRLCGKLRAYCSMLHACILSSSQEQGHCRLEQHELTSSSSTTHHRQASP